MARMISLDDFRKSAHDLGESVAIPEKSKGHRAHEIVAIALQAAADRVKEEDLDLTDFAFACVGDGCAVLMQLGFTVKEIQEWVEDIFIEEENDVLMTEDDDQ